MTFIIKQIVAFFILFSINSQAMSQESKIKQFMDLHFPVKLWVITHPFVVTKSLQISNIARDAAKEREYDPDLDGDYAGGQVDAFRHGFWMAVLTKEIGAKKARKLGRAYEKSNYIDFKKKILEDKYLPDFISSKMDLQNNEVGIKIGMFNKFRTYSELNEIVKKSVLSGDFYVVKKDKEGRFLSSLDKIIPESEYFAKWYTPKTLVNSNYERP
jgi:hypothetical protein